MLSYTYDINFSNLKSWLPQTTRRIVGYLQELSEEKKNLNPPSNEKDKPFDINKTTWQLCLKPKSSRATQVLDKAVSKISLTPSAQEFRLLLELSHMIEIYIKAGFEKIIYRSKAISYSSYKNQHERVKIKEKKEMLSTVEQKKDDTHNLTPLDKISQVLSIPGKVRKSLVTPSLQCSIENVQTEVFNAVLFETCDTKEILCLAYHNEIDKQDDLSTMYECTNYKEVKNGQDKRLSLKVKFYADKNIAKSIKEVQTTSEQLVGTRKIKPILL